jgi:hypothetical protein
LKYEKVIKYKDKVSLNESQKKLYDKNDSNIIIVKLIIFIFMLIFITVHKHIYIINKKSINKEESNKQKITNETNCNKLDPINMFNLRIKNGPKIICQDGHSKHICFQNYKGFYNDVLWNKNGTICLIKYITVILILGIIIIQ